MVAVACILVVGRWLAQLWLEYLNQQHVRQHAGKVPEAFASFIDGLTYAKSVEYTLERSRFSQWESSWDTLILLLVLFSGVLPWAFNAGESLAGHAAWASALILFVLLSAMTVPSLPFDWYGQFRLEQRFGFNTTTPRLWWVDRLKGLVLAFALGFPLLWLILKLTDWAGAWWWCWGWVSFVALQLLLAVIAPTVILPWFNKLTPLPEGSLRERLLALARRTGFQTRGLEVMDGSKRSRHSNAFFAGLGRWRKIVLFDTLIQQLNEEELEAVLAHEIGHYRRHHIPKLLAWSWGGLLAGFAALGWLAQQAWFYRTFGFASGHNAVALLLFSLLAGPVTFWLTPLMNVRSRQYEYEADAFAAESSGAAGLIGALRKLSEKNLSNLTPHPAYSGFYYSHPTLLERETAMRISTSPS